MSGIKFVDDLPPREARGPKQNHAFYAELRAHSGRWAELARYPLARRGSAASRGQALANRHADLEYTVRRIDDEVVLYLRSVQP